MAEYVSIFNKEVEEYAPTCPHRVFVRDGHDDDEINKWMNDPQRPGRWHWAMNADRVAPSRWSLKISDPDVAFEAKIRWG